MTERNPKLNQIVAVVAPRGARFEKTFNEVKKALGSKDLFSGLARTYKPLDDNGEKLPGETKHVQRNVKQELARVAEDMTVWMDAALTRDIGNTLKLADVVVDGVTVISQAPLPFLLYVDKQILGHMRALFEAVPTLSPEEVWTLDESTGNYRSGVVQTMRSLNIKKPLVLHPPTDKHPAQTTVIDEQIPAGTWERVLWSGAVPEVRKRALLDRLGKLHDAVRQAVEEINQAEVAQQKTGKSLFDWL